LSGTVLLPGVSVRPSPVKFGSLQDGALGGLHTITVSNPGQAPLKIFHTAIVGLTPGNFRKGTDRCALHTIQPEGACTVNVRFAPHGRGARKAQLRFGTNAGPGGSFAYVYAGLTGTAVAPPHVIGLRGAVGCTIARLSWRTPDAPRLLGVRVVRNGSRIPRSPGDGTIVRHSSGFLQNGGLTQLHTYYYAVYGVYSAWDSERLVFSRPAVVTLTTGRVCTPLNGSVISDLTPFVDWTPYGRNPRYSIRLVHSGRTILIAFPRRTAFQIPSRWTYGGASHSLARGAVYFLYVYAYTRAFPNGRWIGQTTFAER
jgi:hypothetical protein